MDINVTKPFLPPISEYNAYLKSIWKRGWLTNHGPLVNQLESKLKDFFGLEHLLFVANGTIALQIALRALDLKGEIITTPFSYVATTSSIVWEGCTPVMVDISPQTFNIDPTKVRAAITEHTTAILATHVYGNPCDVEELETIAKEYSLKIIYDAAHAFGTKYKEKSILAYGDISTISFHTTKLFHTIEGGGMTAPNIENIKKISLMRNFGHITATEFACVGVNGKNSEFHAAMGLCNLKYIDSILQTRKKLSEYYDIQLKGLAIRRPTITPGSEYNYAYYPILLESEKVLKELIEALNFNKIFPRRYFYPSLSVMNYIHTKFDTPICDDIASRVLCLPLYHSLSQEEIAMICAHIKRIVE